MPFARGWQCLHRMLGSGCHNPTRRSGWTCPRCALSHLKRFSIVTCCRSLLNASSGSASSSSRHRLQSRMRRSSRRASILSRRRCCRSIFSRCKFGLGAAVLCAKMASNAASPSAARRSTSSSASGPPRCRQRSMRACNAMGRRCGKSVADRPDSSQGRSDCCRCPEDCPARRRSTGQDRSRTA